MPKSNRYKLDPEDLFVIRVALSEHAETLQRIGIPRQARETRELRERLFGTESVIITYPQED